MGAIANLVAYDAGGIAHTFEPVSVSREGNTTTALWRENVASVTLEAQGTVTARSKVLSTNVVMTEVDFAIPVMESIGSQNAAGYTAAPKVAYYLRGKAQFHWHPRSTEALRRFVRQLLANVIQGTAVNVTPITTGQVPDLIDKVMMPT